MASSTLALEAQARWETEGCRRAIARYREAAASQNPADLPPGQALLRLCVPPLAAALKARQAEAATPAERSHGAPWEAAVAALDAEQLAVLTLSTVLRSEAGETGYSEARSVRSVCLALASAVAAQVDYERWTATADDDLVARVARRHPDMDAKTWRRLRKKLDGLDPVKWSVSERLQIGGVLLDALVTACSDWFTTETRHVGAGRTELIVVLRDAARKLMDDRAARAEVARPLLMPMLIPPIDWRYE